MVKELSLEKQKKSIINVFNDVNAAFDIFKKFDTVIKVNFENDIKNKIIKAVDIIINE